MVRLRPRVLQATSKLKIFSVCVGGGGVCRQCPSPSGQDYRGTPIPARLVNTSRSQRASSEHNVISYELSRFLTFCTRRGGNLESQKPGQLPKPGKPETQKVGNLDNFQVFGKPRKSETWTQTTSNCLENLFRWKPGKLETEATSSFASWKPRNSETQTTSKIWTTVFFFCQLSHSFHTECALVTLIKQTPGHVSEFQQPPSFSPRIVAWSQFPCAWSRMFLMYASHADAMIGHCNTQQEQ